MMSFHRGSLCVRHCGLSMDPEGRANFGRSFEAGFLRIPFSLKSEYAKISGLTLQLVYSICRLL